MKERVSVIGVGRLGLSFALLLDSKGYEVIGCDVNEKYIESLKNKTFQSKEPEINEMLAKTTMLFTTNAMTALERSETLFVFVQTPSNGNGSYDHKHIDQVISKIESESIRHKTLVIGCTVMPHYSETLRQRIKNLGITVVYNPEFIAQGSIVHGLRYADMVLFGGSVPPLLYRIYTDIMEIPTVFKKLSLTGAEIAKISINCFLTMKIAFANLIGEIIINSSQESWMEDILEAIGSDSRIGRKCLQYGFPAGGVCLPRDQRALNSHAYYVGIDTKFLHSIDAENSRHHHYLVNYYAKQNPNKSIPFVFSHLSYKQGVDILTDSFQLKVCIALLRMGYKVDVPANVKDMDTPEEFKNYCYHGMVTFENNPSERYKIN